MLATLEEFVGVMRHKSSKFATPEIVILVSVLICTGPVGPVWAQMDGAVLLLQQTPAEGGIVTPGVGVHHLQPGADLTLTAVPKPGYQFVYWMGDVADPAANRTTVYLDTPKIVIAVFERAQYEFVFSEVASHIAPGGGTVRSAVQTGQSGFGGPGGKRPHKLIWPRQRIPFESPEPPEPPVPPDEPEDFVPVPEVPEPATVILLLIGSLGLLRKPQGKKKHL
ncbi:MAG: InlB B-repeat-containing protein [Planctomycetota bacterium]